MQILIFHRFDLFTLVTSPSGLCPSSSIWRARSPPKLFLLFARGTHNAHSYTHSCAPCTSCKYLLTILFHTAAFDDHQIRRGSFSTPFAIISHCTNPSAPTNKKKAEKNSMRLTQKKNRNNETLKHPIAVQN